ncbi:LysR substrate-binding domain-containing protein [Aquabacter spiritensis]|uniref:LysR family transcriptional regulator n=1 Tax=Aquabacter spiritensis TaxID=933073 RepID=A0A4R3M0J6_9HYPH|nr:LysR substrate-binding domain-containing protein [Aquabacter spiritensis]TCT06591.1 LysR family transcriptional regulator [Aquabacter spiritensis]
MLDLDLLRAFVSVVDAGGFTRAGERVHRTQSTVSQQIKRLEAEAGQPLFLRAGRRVRLTEPGERLLGYARRILALSAEAKAALGHTAPVTLRLGIPDDFALSALTRAVGTFAAARPEVRLAVRCGVSCDLSADLARGDLDVALHKREPRSGSAYAVWPEQPCWIAGADHPLPALDPVPLVAFTHGCLYRSRAIHALEAAGLAWRIAYESPNLLGLQAALASGLGIAVLERRIVTAEHRILGTADGLPPVPPTEIALGVADGAPPAALDLAAALARFCGTVQAHAA